MRPRRGGDALHDLQTVNGHYLFKLTLTGNVDESALLRFVRSSRARAFAQARKAVTEPLERAGFTSVPDEPED